MSLPRPSARARRRLARPAPFWVAAVVLAAVTGLTVARLVGDAAAEAARWGDLRPTLVATTDLDPGEVVGPGDTEVRRLPAALVPAGALDRPADGAVVAAAVHAGEPVVAARLAPAGVSPAAARLPAGTRGVAVPTGPGALGLEVGDAVDVLATFEPGHGEVEPTVVVARGAVVVDVGDESVTVAVARREAPRVAFALAAGVVALALVGATGGG